MTAPKPIGSMAELYAHALAIEREAAARYAELAQLMTDQGNGPAAALFTHLAAREAQHADAIVAHAKGLELPVLRPWEYSWLDSGPPERVAHEFVFRLITPAAALKIALEAEQRARDFFEQVFAAAADPDLKLLAAAMAQEEAQHIEWLERALATEPDPGAWERLFSRPGDG